MREKEKRKAIEFWAVFCRDFLLWDVKKSFLDCGNSGSITRGLEGGARHFLYRKVHLCHKMSVWLSRTSGVLRDHPRT